MNHHLDFFQPNHEPELLGEVNVLDWKSATLCGEMVEIILGNPAWVAVSNSDDPGCKSSISLLLPIFIILTFCWGWDTFEARGEGLIIDGEGPELFTRDEGELMTLKGMLEA